MTAGFSEFGESGAALQRELLETAGSHGMRIVGPNCLGVIVPSIGLNGSFAPAIPARGDVAFVSQSGALVTVVLDWAQPRGIGFSRVISLGDMADVDFGDVLEYVAGDPSTQSVVLYIEGVTDAGKFMAAARALSRSKPVVVLKVGRRVEGAKAARSHTGALAGSDVVYDAALRRAGMLRVESLPQLFDALETLALTAPARGDRLAILTNGGGPGVIATDALIEAGGKLAALSAATLERLNTFLPKTWSRGNPIDMIGDSPAKDYAAALDALLEDEQVDAVLVLHAPTALTDPREPARAIIEVLRAHANDSVRRNVYAAWLGDHAVSDARRLLADARVPAYETPDDAVQGFIDRVRYQRAQALAAESAAPGDFRHDAAAARAIFERAAATGPAWLDADDVSRALEAYGIRVARSRSVRDPAEAADAASEIGGPIALKIRSPQLTHKTDFGGVVLDLEGAERVRLEAAAMLKRIRELRPDARIDGLLVQEMVRRPGAVELIAGVSTDPVFGPIVLFGQGGTAVELIADTSLELPPLNPSIARAQIARTGVSRLLHGYRDHPPADLEAIAGVLMRIGGLAIEQPLVHEIDINPLLADSHGVIAVDARIMVSPQVKTPPALRSGAERS